jgi:very-short-patch-repair endonuclease
MLPMQNKARQLRKAQTETEQHLWRQLRNRSLAGCKFRRQHPIGPYICDFVCLDHRLVIEVDGGQHALQVDEDNARSAYLESRGFTVMRFWNHEVLGQTEAVLEKIAKMIASDSPHPVPLPKGARGR